jgi:hypothetical protein
MELLSVKLLENASDSNDNIVTVALNECVLIYWNPENSDNIGMEYNPDDISEEDANSIIKEFFIELKKEQAEREYETRLRIL